jgi:hypothetical protein
VTSLFVDDETEHNGGNRAVARAHLAEQLAGNPPATATAGPGSGSHPLSAAERAALMRAQTSDGALGAGPA